MTISPRLPGSRLDRLLDGWAVAEPLEIQGLCHDSRRVCPGTLFIALAGQRSHGLHHAEQAIRQGCAAIAYDPAGAGGTLAAAVTAVPCIPVEDLAGKLGGIADRYYGAPSQDLQAIAVTGTNGKTSCTHFLAQALSAHGRAGVIGTLGWGTPGRLHPTAHTTPDAIEVHELLARLRDQGYGAVAMEASSHGQVQGRLNGVRFRGALYTNFSRDHLDYHGTMEAYLQAKLSLLNWPALAFVVFNADDPIGPAIREHLPAGLRGIAFSVDGGGHGHLSDLQDMLTLSDIRHGSTGISFCANYQGHGADVAAPVYGDFNVQNLAGSLAVLLALGWELPDAAAALGKVGPVPGRMESHEAAGRTVVIDYAHTPDALANVLGGLRRHCRGRLWVVFGCGGDRDRGKRPEMGAIAENLADTVVLTDDNPRSEDGDGIIADILSGCDRPQGIACIRDRRDAIAWTIERAEPGDVVLVAGKGHETTQEVLGTKYPFCDREVVRELLLAGETA